MVFRCTNPAHTNRIDREMDRLFSTFFSQPGQPATASRPAAFNVWEDDEAWLLEAELPGVSPDHLEVSVVNNELTVSVKRPESQSGDLAYSSARATSRGFLANHSVADGDRCRRGESRSQTRRSDTRAAQVRGNPPSQNPSEPRRVTRPLNRRAIPRQ